MNVGQKTLLDILPKESPEFTAMDALTRNKRKHFCPACKQHYDPTFPTKDLAMSQGVSSNKEQWLSGICSDKCWDDYLG